MNKLHLILIILLCFFFCACSSDESQNNTSETSSDTFNSKLTNSSSNANTPSTNSKSIQENSTQISANKVEKDLVGKATDTTKWTFQVIEPRNIQILESEYSGKIALIVINLETCNSDFAGAYEKGVEFVPSAGDSWAGKLRLHYELIANEWILRQVEELTFKHSPEGNSKCKDYWVNRRKKTNELKPNT